MRTKKRRAHAPQVQHHLVQQHKHLVSFHLQAQPANFWVFRISVSIRRLDRSHPSPPQHLACDLRRVYHGGIDLLAWLQMGCGLNSR